MSVEWTQHLSARDSFLRHSLRSLGVLTPVALGMVVAFGATVATGDEPTDIGSRLGAIGKVEDSILVSNTQATDDDQTSHTPLDSALEPISQYAEEEPELAEPELTPPPRPLNLSTNVTKASSDFESQASESQVADETDNEVGVDLDTSDTIDQKTSTDGAQGANTDVGNIYTEQSKPAPAFFHGLQPGVSSRKQLQTEWGQPAETAPTEGGELLSYEMQPFRQVDVLVEDDVVSLIRVEFARLEPFDELRRKVRVDTIDYVELTDDSTGNVLGYAFPERGMVLVLAGATDVTPTDTNRVEQMILQPLDSQAFTLRAERRSVSAVSDNLTDLEQAIELDGQNAQAHWLMAGVRLTIGQAELAYEAAKRAVDLESDNSAYKLRLAETLVALGRYDQAVLMTRGLLDDESIPANTRAAAFFQMGQLASLGEVDVAEKAIGFHTTAINLADKLASEGDLLERRAAKQLLVAAHLAIAHEVSRREFTNKIDSVSQWVGRASGLAEEAIESGDGGLELRLAVASESLAALVNIKPARDPQPLINEAEEVFAAIQLESNDPLWLNEMQWRMGIAHMSAVQIEHHRRQTPKAIKSYQAALNYFTEGSESRDSVPSTVATIGRLYFHVGALHAVHRGDHTEAVKWYDKAEPMLSTERPESTLYVPRREGEALVSMAVSYWDQDDYEHAVELTETGAKLIEQAVAGGVVEETTLAVPYGNLSVMHKQLGNSAAALKYSKLADASKRATSSQQASRPLPQQPAATSRTEPSRTVPATTSNDVGSNVGNNTTNRRPAQQPPQQMTQDRTAMQSPSPSQSQPRSVSGRSKRPSAARTLHR